MSSRRDGRSERETTPKGQCRQAEIARKRPIFRLIRRSVCEFGTGADEVGVGLLPHGLNVVLCKSSAACDMAAATALERQVSELKSGI